MIVLSGSVAAPSGSVIENVEIDWGDGWTVNENPRFFGDVNGDGSDDLIAFDEDHVIVKFSAGTP